MPNLGFRCCKGTKAMPYTDPCASTTCANVLSSYGLGTSSPYTFESGLQGWTLSGEFERGAPTDWAGAHGGSNVLGVDLDADYNNYASDQALSPLLNLSCCAGSTVYLRAYVKFDTEGGAGCPYDYATMQVWNGVTWISPTLSTGSYTSSGRWCGTNSGWVQYIANVTPYLNANFRVSFRMSADDSVTDRGVYVDDVYLYIP
jgi:hypothetical protein